jgi:hypothetical protein
LLIAYLVLARFAGMKPVGTHGPNMVTGAGATAVAKAMKMRWSRANELVKKLLELNGNYSAPIQGMRDNPAQCKSYPI